jgi:nucleotide-binding universal stress UspA family protein
MAANRVIAFDAAPVRFARILVPIDFSTYSDHAISYARVIAEAYRSHIILIHVLHTESSEPTEAVVGLCHRSFNEHFRQVEKHIRALENSVVLRGSDHSISIEQGGVIDMVVNAVSCHAVDLVVIGTHRRRGLNKVLRGSIAEAVSRKALCPVLMVGPQVPPAAPEFVFNHVLYATEYSPGSLHAMRYARSIAQHHAADLILLHVCSFLEGNPLVDDATMLAQERDRLRSLLPEDTALARSAAVIARFGITPDAILRTATETKADLIVMGSHSGGAVSAAAHMPWTIAHRVVSHANCPVLTVRG